jgi:transcriptional regulator with XRE-family HTH domain
MSSRLNRANLDRELARRGWTADDLAVASDVSAATISSARHGRPMRHKTLQKIADALVKAPIVAGSATRRAQQFAPDIFCDWEALLIDGFSWTVRAK